MTVTHTRSAERFMREIITRIPIERVTELRLFPVMRHGGSETGVAVVASEPDDVVGDGTLTAASRGGAEGAEQVVGGGSGMAGEDIRDEAGDDDQGVAEGNLPADRAASANRRHVIYSARYRLLLKGAERGKWEFELTAEADAPLATVDSVVRGVLRRTGDEVSGEPERLTAAAIRDVLRLEASPVAP
jgi:hypothetical protein